MEQLRRVFNTGPWWINAEKGEISISRIQSLGEHGHAIFLCYMFQAWIFFSNRHNTKQDAKSMEFTEINLQSYIFTQIF